MRGFTFTREFHIPQGAVKVADKQSDAIAYLYPASHNGKPCAMLFLGKSQKPAWRHLFNTEQAREKYIAEAFANWRAYKARRAVERAERSKPHTLKVGDILHTSWGYEQTNVEFFQVTRIVGPHTVELREIAQERSETGWLRGTCKPAPGKFLTPRHEGDDRGVPIVRRANANNSVKIDDVRYAWRGGGEHSWTAYH